MPRTGAGGRIFFGREDVGLPVLRVQARLQAERRGDRWVPRSPGRLCRATSIELTAWQKAHGIPDTGVVDRHTWHLMFDEGAPAIQARIFSAGAWMLGLDFAGRIVDGPLGLRWGYWGLSSRSGALRAALKTLKALPPEGRDPLVHKVFTFSARSQVAYWWGSRRSARSRTGWLPQQLTPEVQKVQYARALQLWGDLPQDNHPSDSGLEVELAGEVLPRIFADTLHTDRVQDWKIGMSEGFLDQFMDLQVALSAGVVPKRRGVDGWIPNGERPLSRFGIG